MIAAAKRRGIAITSISRPIKPSDFRDFDLILAMDRQNKSMCIYFSLCFLMLLLIQMPSRFSIMYSIIIWLNKITRVNAKGCLLWVKKQYRLINYLLWWVVYYELVWLPNSPNVRLMLVLILFCCKRKYLRRLIGGRTERCYMLMQLRRFCALTFDAVSVIMLLLMYHAFH